MVSGDKVAVMVPNCSVSCSGACSGNKAVISAGTGLGKAGLYWDGAMHRPFACEGGHADFAPVNDLQIELLQFEKCRFNRLLSLYELPL